MAERTTSGNVPSTSRSSGNVPATTKGASGNVPATSKPEIVRPDRVLSAAENRQRAEALPANSRAYAGQKLGVQLQDGRTDPIPDTTLHLALVGLDHADGRHVPGLSTRILDVSPNSGLPIVLLK